MRRRVHLLGPFKAYADGPIEIEAETAWDAIEGVTRQIKGFTPHPINGRQRIQAVGFKTLADLKAKSDVVDIYIMPAMTFGKNGGLIQTVIGITLIIVAITIPIPIPGFNVALLASGLSLTIGGLLQMLMPQPKATTEARSKYLSINQNTVAIGTPIPLLYGRFRTGGQLMSLMVVSKSQPGSSLNQGGYLGGTSGSGGIIGGGGGGGYDTGHINSA